MSCNFWASGAARPKSSGINLEGACAAAGLASSATAAEPTRFATEDDARRAAQEAVGTVMLFMQKQLERNPDFLSALAFMRSNILSYFVHICCSFFTSLVLQVASSRWASLDLEKELLAPLTVLLLGLSLRPLTDRTVHLLLCQSRTVAREEIDTETEIVEIAEGGDQRTPTPSAVSDDGRDAAGEKKIKLLAR